MTPITDIEEMKTIQLDIMRSVHRFCEENQITYFLSHGSLIGAVRHKGFIPWDDDIDLFMPREEYERFCKLFSNAESQYHLRIANSETKPYYGRPMSKVYDTRTLLVEPNYVGDDPIGINIDIWPLDGIPADEKRQKVHLRQIKILQKVLYGRVVRMKACKGIIQKSAHFVLLPFSSRQIVHKINHCLLKYHFENSTNVTCAVDPYKKVYKRDWFDYAVLANFEGEQFFIPNGANEILSTIYGDYMKLPPESKRIPHHITNAYWR